MPVTQILEQEIKDSELWLSRTQEESTYKRDLKKRIELINWVLENMKNPDVQICNLIESSLHCLLSLSVANSNHPWKIPNKHFIKWHLSMLQQ
jgi:hypothetical protein